MFCAKYFFHKHTIPPASALMLLIINYSLAIFENTNQINSLIFNTPDRQSGSLIESGCPVHLAAAIIQRAEKGTAAVLLS